MVPYRCTGSDLPCSAATPLPWRAAAACLRAFLDRRPHLFDRQQQTDGVAPVEGSEAFLRYKRQLLQVGREGREGRSGARGIAGVQRNTKP